MSKIVFLQFTTVKKTVALTRLDLETKKCDARVNMMISMSQYDGEKTW